MPLSFIPYGRQSLDQDDVQQVLQTLQSGWLTTGPQVLAFETAFAAYLDAGQQAVAVSNGTAALHAVMHAIDIQPGDEVIVPPMTFAASSNAVLFKGGTPVFVDVLPGTLLIDPEQVAQKIGPKTKAIVAVDYGGQPCDYAALRSLIADKDIVLVADACHALGAGDAKGLCGTHADISVFSFHPVKPITTAEGGMVVTWREDWIKRIRTFCNHGITTDHRQRAQQGAWFYEMIDLGFNYRLSDIQCALGLTQLKKINRFISKRQKIAKKYDRAIGELSTMASLEVLPKVCHGYHLYVVRCPERDRLFGHLRDRAIGTAVHFIPVHLHPYYQKNLGTGRGDCPVAEAAYDEILSLPIFPDLTCQDQKRVIKALQEFAL